jgi:hypothetical protein
MQKSGRFKYVQSSAIHHYSFEGGLADLWTCSQRCTASQPWSLEWKDYQKPKALRVESRNNGDRQTDHREASHHAKNKPGYWHCKTKQRKLDQKTAAIRWEAQTKTRAGCIERKNKNEENNEQYQMLSGVDLSVRRMETRASTLPTLRESSDCGLSTCWPAKVELLIADAVAMILKLTNCHTHFP